MVKTDTTISVILWGGGGHAKVVYTALKSAGRRVVQVIDSKYGGDFFGIEKSVDYNSQSHRDSAMVVAIGDNRIRKKLVSQCKHAFASVIHSSAIISEDVVIGEGSMLLHGSIVQTGAVIGNHVILNTGSQVDHDCAIGDFVHIAPRAVLCGNVKVGEGALVGAGAVVTPGVTIGAWAVVGAGAVVLKDVPDGITVGGVPAKILSAR